MNNKELKRYAASKGVRLWQVAEKFGLNDANFSRKLRHDLNEQDAKKFIVYVDELSEDK